MGYFAGAWDPIANKIDTSYSGTVTITKISGPGNVMGDLSVAAVKWGNGNIEIDSVGTYQLEFDLTGLGKDTIEVTVLKNEGGSGGGTGGGGESFDPCLGDPGFCKWRRN